MWGESVVGAWGECTEKKTLLIASERVIRYNDFVAGEKLSLPIKGRRSILTGR